MWVFGVEKAILHLTCSLAGGCTVCESSEQCGTRGPGPLWLTHPTRPQPLPRQGGALGPGLPYIGLGMVRVLHDGIV